MATIKERAIVWDEKRRALREQHLAPGLTWEEVMVKYHTDDQNRLRRQMDGFIKFEEFSWLRRRVGAGRVLFDEHRAVITADTDQRTDFAVYANVPHKSRTYYDAESMSPENITGKPTEFRPGQAEAGLDELAWNLALVVKNGKVDKGTLAFYWLCWMETAGVVIKRLTEQGSLLPAGLSEYQINPELVERANRLEAKRIQAEEREAV